MLCPGSQQCRSARCQARLSETRNRHGSDAGPFYPRMGRATLTESRSLSQTTWIAQKEISNLSTLLRRVPISGDRSLSGDWMARIYS